MHEASSFCSNGESEIAGICNQHGVLRDDTVSHEHMQRRVNTGLHRYDFESAWAGPVPPDMPGRPALVEVAVAAKTSDVNQRTNSVSFHTLPTGQFSIARVVGVQTIWMSYCLVN
jgi:hypothetical protein